MLQSLMSQLGSLQISTSEHLSSLMHTQLFPARDIYGVNTVSSETLTRMWDSYGS